MKVKFNLDEATNAQRRSGSYSPTVSLTSALDGCGLQSPCSGRFTPREGVPVPIVLEAEWAPGPVWTGAETSLPQDSMPGPSSP